MKLKRTDSVLGEVRPLDVLLKGGLEESELTLHLLAEIGLTELLERELEVSGGLRLLEVVDSSLVASLVHGLTLLPGTLDGLKLSLESGNFGIVEVHGVLGLVLLGGSHGVVDGLGDLLLELLTERGDLDLAVIVDEVLELRSLGDSLSLDLDILGTGVSLKSSVVLGISHLHGLEGVETLLVNLDSDHGGDIVHGELGGSGGNESGNKLHSKK